MPAEGTGRKGVELQIDTAEAIAWLIERAAPAALVPNPDADPERMAPQDRLAWYKGETERRKNALEAGLVVYAEDVRDTMAGLLKRVMLTLETLTVVVSRKARLSPEQSEAIDDAIDGERRALHADLKSLADDGNRAG